MEFFKFYLQNMQIIDIINSSIKLKKFSLERMVKIYENNNYWKRLKSNRGN